MYVYYWGWKCYFQDFAFPYLLFLCRQCHRVMHSQPCHLFGVLPWYQHICFNPTCYPWEQWLEVQSFHSTGDLINHTRVSDPNKPVSIYFDVCAAIAKNTATWGYCGGLPGKGPIGYMTNMCPETTSLVSVCVHPMSSSTALIGAVWYGQLGRGKGLLPFSRKGKQPLTVLLHLQPCKFYDFQSQ
jgi:hypothetical protein